MQPKNQPEKPEKRSDSVLMQSISMALGTMTSRVLGLVREMAFVGLFSTAITDAWYIAFKVPNFFRRLLGEGSLSVAFIPVFMQAQKEDPSGVRAKNLVNAFYSVLLLVLGTLTALGLLFAEPIVRMLVDQSYELNLPQFEMTVRFAQIMFCFIFFISHFAFFMGILNSFGRFAWPAVAPTFFNVAMLASNFYPKEWQVVEGDALAWGVVLGGFLQAAVLFPSLYKLGFLPRFSSDWRNSEVWRIWKNMFPGMAGIGLMQVTTLVNANFVSGLPMNSTTYLNLADRLLELPLSLVAVSLGTALLPTLSRYWIHDQKVEMVNTANFYLRIGLLVAMPAAIGLYFLAHPITELLFQRGEFTPEKTLGTAAVVRIYSFTLIASTLVRVIIPNFYAVKNTWLPAVVSGLCLVVHLILAPLLIARLQLEGLVISTLISAALNFVLLAFAFRWFFGALGWSKIAEFLVRMTLPLLAVIGICLSHSELLDFFGLNLFGQLVSLVLVVLSSGLVYFALGFLLKSKECEFVVGGIRRRLIKKS